MNENTLTTWGLVKMRRKKKLAKKTVEVRHSLLFGLMSSGRLSLSEARMCEAVRCGDVATVRSLLRPTEVAPRIDGVVSDSALLPVLTEWWPQIYKAS
jgi:hypothetical protein